jgi:hypothetical protein
MFGLARVQVRLALHILYTNNSALFKFEYSFTLLCDKCGNPQTPKVPDWRVFVPNPDISG